MEYIVIIHPPYEHLCITKQFSTRQGAIEYAKGTKKNYLKEYRGDSYALSKLKVTVVEVIEAV